MDTLIRHLTCGEPIFVVRGGLNPGDEVRAAMFEPLNPEWPHPKAGDETICPNCHRGFLTSDTDLQRVNVEQW